MLAQTVLAQATKRHLMELAAWLTTWDRCTTGGRHVWLPQAAWSPLVSAAIAAIGIGADADDIHLHALMVVRLTDALHPMLSLTPAEYEQSLFCSSVCGADMAGRLCSLSVSSRLHISMPSRLPACQCSVGAAPQGRGYLSETWRSGCAPQRVPNARAP